MPHGPFKTTVLTATTSPSPTASDPPVTAMVWVPDRLTLLPHEWTVSKVGSSEQGKDFNLTGAAGSDPTATNSAITFLSSGGGGGGVAGYANGQQYANGGVIHATPATAPGTITIYNGGFEVNTNSPTWNSGAAVTQDGWTAFGQNSSGFTLTEVTGGKTGTVNGLAHDAGSNYGYINANGTAGWGMWLQLMDSTATTGLSLTNLTSTVVTTYSTGTLTAGGAVAGQAVRLRLIVTSGASASGYDLINAQGFAYLLSNAFIYDGNSITVRYAKTSSSSGSSQHWYFDTCTNGRADYSGTHVYTSPEIRMPAAWSTTQEAVSKLWYNVTVNFDIPATNTSIGVPAGHGARIDIQARSGSVQGAAWGSMDGGAAQTLAPHSPYTTTNAMGQTFTVPIDGAPAIATNPYLRFQITFNSGVVAPSATVNTGTVTPVIKDVIVRFFNPNDNFYWSQERDLGSGASAFGVFNATATAAGSTITYSYRAASTETALHTTAWANVASGAVPGGAFGRYFQWAAQIQPAASQATDPATFPYIDAVSFNYTIGSELTAGPVASTWVDKRYWFFCQERNQTFNNRAWCLDSNLAWSKHNNLNASCAAVYKNFMLFGVQRAPTATANLTSGRVGIFDRSNDDDGVKVPWVLKTKEYPSQDLRAPVTIRAVDILGRAMSAVSTPGIAVGLGGFGYTVAAASWNIAAVSSGFTYSTQVMNMGGSGQEAGHANFPANRWGSTVGLIISGDKPASRAQIDKIQISTMRKEPQVR